MKRLPNNALHKALVPFLREKTGYRVYDYVPETAQLPFITLGAVNVQDKSTKTEDMTKTSVHIHIYSNYKGRFEINTLAESLINTFAVEQVDLSADEFAARPLIFTRRIRRMRSVTAVSSPWIC